jgi:hypothetical protein
VYFILPTDIKPGKNRLPEFVSAPVVLYEHCLRPQGPGADTAGAEHILPSVKGDGERRVVEMRLGIVQYPPPPQLPATGFYEREILHGSQQPDGGILSVTAHYCTSTERISRQSQRRINAIQARSDPTDDFAPCFRSARRDARHG